MKKMKKKRKKLNECTLWSYAKHYTKDCRFKFGEDCFNYGLNHMTFLCRKPHDKIFADKSNYNNVSTGVVWMGTVLSQSV